MNKELKSIGVLTEVKWRDAYHESGWKSLKNFKLDGIKLRQRTVGYVTYEDREVVVLAQSIDDHMTDQKAADFMIIPKSSIEHRRKVAQ